MDSKTANYDKLNYANAKRLMPAGNWSALVRGEYAEKPRMITALFKDKESAEKAYVDVLHMGYSDQDINVIMSEDSKSRYFRANPSIKQPAEEAAKRMVGSGIPEQRVKPYREELQQGGILLGIQLDAETDVDEIQQTWQASHGAHIHAY